MKLLFDIGNSSIDWALQKGDTFLVGNKFQYDSTVLIQKLEQEIYLTVEQQPTAILISSVAENDVINTLQNWVNMHWQLEIWQAKVTANFGELINSYKDSQQMGIDRWLAIIASWNKYKGSLCIVDCGTALTIDCVAPSGKHLGGYILPNVEMMQQALIEKTKKINISINKQFSIKPADNTQASISHGATLAVVATINHVVKEINNHPICIITGGMARSIKPLLKDPFTYEPDLVLRGLAILYNAKK